MPPTIEFSKRCAARGHHKDIKTCNVNKTSFLGRTPAVTLRIGVVMGLLIGAFLSDCNATT